MMNVLSSTLFSKWISSEGNSGEIENLQFGNSSKAYLIRGATV